MEIIVECSDINRGCANIYGEMVREIVRCRDCEFAEVADKNDDQDGYICQFHRGSIWFSGSFCSWGKRKEGE